jgi:hypothetical protein
VGNVLLLPLLLLLLLLLLAELGHVGDHFDAKLGILFLLPAAGR